MTPRSVVRVRGGTDKKVRNNYRIPSKRHFKLY